MTKRRQAGLPKSGADSGRDGPPSLAAFGALIGDPVRAAIVTRLTDGTWRPASELAYLAGASPQAASAHLTKLVEGGLLAVEKQGRHRFYRLRSGEVAEIVEWLSNWTDSRPRQRPIDPALGRARLCYDHLAGQLGIALHDRLTARGWLVLGTAGPVLSPSGVDWCLAQGLDPVVPSWSRRPLVRLCLDWTERHHHLSGHLGAELARVFLKQGYLRRRPGARIVDVTPKGTAFLRRALEIDLTG